MNDVVCPVWKRGNVRKAGWFSAYLVQWIPNTLFLTLIRNFDYSCHQKKIPISRWSSNHLKLDVYILHIIMYLHMYVCRQSTHSQHHRHKCKNQQYSHSWIHSHYLFPDTHWYLWEQTSNRAPCSTVAVSIVVSPLQVWLSLFKV